MRQAVIANFVSSCFCFMGLVFGKMVGEIEDVNLWILGVTGGFFLYIALTNKVSNLLLRYIEIFQYIQIEKVHPIVHNEKDGDCSFCFQCPEVKNC